jgi:GNAT superfamily N-acetyltransferase
MRFFEISRLPKSEIGDWGDKGTLADPEHPIKTKPLPGGSKFSYAVNKPEAEHIEIMIFDGRTLAAEMDLFYTQDYMKTWKVDTVVVDPDYRGQGLGKALYGIALSILRLTIEAGEMQTRHGQQMWLMLNSIPGVEVQGYNMERTNEYQPKSGDKVVDQNKDWTRYTFPVKSGTSSMRSGRRGTGIYTTQATMIARWTGR